MELFLEISSSHHNKLQGHPIQLRHCYSNIPRPYVDSSRKTRKSSTSMPPQSSSLQAHLQQTPRSTTRPPRSPPTQGHQSHWFAPHNLRKPFLSKSGNPGRQPTSSASRCALPPPCTGSAVLQNVFMHQTPWLVQRDSGAHVLLPSPPHPSLIRYLHEAQRGNARRFWALRSRKRERAGWCLRSPWSTSRRCLGSGKEKRRLPSSFERNCKSP